MQTSHEAIQAGYFYGNDRPPMIVRNLAVSARVFFSGSVILVILVTSIRLRPAGGRMTGMAWQVSRESEIFSQGPKLPAMCATASDKRLHVQVHGLTKKRSGSSHVRDLAHLQPVTCTAVSCRA